MNARHLCFVRSLTVAARIRAQGASPVTGSLRRDVRRLAPAALIALAALIVVAAASSRAAEVGSAFSYQGFLEKPAGTPLTDTCMFEFKLCDDAAAACAPGTISNHPGIAVTDGVFTVADVDFGAGAFTGEARWMEVYVQCTGDGGPVALSPRVELTPAPYSIRAGEGVGGPNALNVTPSGDVGIGTTTPAARLDVNGAARTTTLEITGGVPFVQTLVGWGDNDYGQSYVPSGTFIAVAAGVNHSIAIHTGGTLAGWGNAGYGQIYVPSGTFNAVAAGGRSSVAVRSDGTLAGWGYNDDGQINVPAGTFTAVAVGGNFSLAIHSDGTLVGWGSNAQGQTNVPNGTFIAVAAGVWYSLAIRSDGTLVGWGHNGSGQTNVPTGTFTAVAAGYSFGLAIRSDGTLVGWGDNTFGQINVPAGTFIAVAATYRHSLAIRNDGTLVGWGYNFYGQTTVPSGTFTAVAAGGGHSLAIRSDGTLVGWGSNLSGEINVPAGTFVAVAAGLYHSLASRRDSANQPALLLHNNSAYKPGSDRWTISSDRRLKKNIEPLSGALERLLQLRGVTFQWLDPASQGGITGTQMGLIADEVRHAFPQWVGRDPKGYQTLTVGGFEALTAEALRELRAEKDRQLQEKDCEIQDLRFEIENLKEQVRGLDKEHGGGRCDGRDLAR
jgi:hypothetical protein